MRDEKKAVKQAAALDLLIKGDLVLPGRVLKDGYVAVADGRIAAVGQRPLPAVRGAVHDFTGKWVLPGVVDGQVHCGTAIGWSGMPGMTRAALTGGTTTAVDMPYDNFTLISNADILRRKMDMVERSALIDIALFATIEKQDGVAAIPGLVEAGACAFKMSTRENSPTRFPRITHPDLYEAFRTIAPTGLPIHIHNEDEELVSQRLAALSAEGKTAVEWHEPSRPPIAELIADAVVFEIGAYTGARVHLVHSSLARGFDLAALYRAGGCDASGETCIHYLVFSNEDMLEVGARLKWNPPLRPLPEKEALWRCLHEGKIKFITSDHSSWPLSSKQSEVIFNNTSGAPGIETLLLAFYTAAVAERGVPIEIMSYYIAEAPARHFGLYPKKGVIEVGSDADLAVLDPTPYVFNETAVPNQPCFSIYQGREMAGRVVATFLRGRHAFDGENILVEEGYGEFIRPLGRRC